MIRVLVQADSALIRAGLEAILREDARFVLIANEARTNVASTPLLLGARSQLDVVVADIGDRRLGSSPILRSGETSLPIVLLADGITRSDLLKALRSGVRAVLPRDAQPAELCAAIEAAVAGLTAFGPQELDILLPLRRGLPDEEVPVLTEALTSREIEVLTLMSQGLLNKNIADRLHISEHTVKFHVSSILSKFGVSSRTEAVTTGLRDGLLSL